MQLKTLTIHNIASIEDARIDFSGAELGKAPIFLICGETGAGKTTILDAICLSLYGETPRMTSMSKEELELTEPSESRVEKYYSNDNSQLLHRGAGEGLTKLLFTGNDGRDYEAVWEVHRAHNKAHKRLLRPTRMLRAIDGSYTENRINEIKVKVVEVTGLEYDQFCRTVMLAQGEFTKFLKSNRSEKSEILEKLTGTEIYSRIGSKIAERYNTARAHWLQLKMETESVKLMEEEERTRMAETREGMKREIESLSLKQSVLAAKLNWLAGWQKFEELKRGIDEEIQTLSKSMENESFKEDTLLVKEYETSAEGRGILDNIEKNNKEIKLREASLPELESNSAAATEALKTAADKCIALEEEIVKLEEELEKTDIEGLNGKFHELTMRDKLLAELTAAMDKVKGEEKTLGVLESQKRELLERISSNNLKAECLKGPVADAEREWHMSRERLEKAEVSVSDIVKELRGRLKKNDTCPVCGAAIDRDIEEGHFESLLEPLREAKRNAEVTYTTLRANVDSACKLVEVDSKTLDRTESKHRKATVSVESLRREALEIKKKASMEDISDDSMPTVCEKERQALSNAIESIRERQKAADSLQKEVKKLRRKQKDISAQAEKCKEAAHAASLKLQETSSEIKALVTTRDGYWESMRLFFINHPDLSMQRLTKLRGYTEREISDIKTRLNLVEDRLKMARGKLETVEAQIKGHLENRPEFDKEETKESLEEWINEIDKDIRHLSEESGRLGEALEHDNRLRKELEGRYRKLDESRERLDRWEGLYNKLGDMKGVKFRSIAQSFILKTLLENANVYMRSFNDRYTLTCNPGTLAILVKDDYKPSEPQPASILSGGESFMASLSLALALSNLKGGGMTTDILFIDEGFGTLSAEYLGNVMDTLEKLHRIGGRKVGLISHVAEMKERIPVQIRVKRESPALSRVEIVEAY